ncbi:MAG: hypothetical protein AAB421_00060 [Patescibacteria group bacterium]
MQVVRSFVDTSLLATIFVSSAFLIVTTAFAAIPPDGGATSAAMPPQAGNPCAPAQPGAPKNKGRLGGAQTNDIVTLNGEGDLAVTCKPLPPGEEAVVTYIGPDGEPIVLSKGSREANTIESLIQQVRTSGEFPVSPLHQWGTFGHTGNAEQLVHGTFGADGIVQMDPRLESVFGATTPQKQAGDALNFIITRGMEGVDIQTASDQYNQVRVDLNNRALEAIATADKLGEQPGYLNARLAELYRPDPQRENLYQYIERMYPPADWRQRVNGIEFGDPLPLAPLFVPDAPGVTFENYPALERILRPPPDPTRMDYYQDGGGVFDTVRNDYYWARDKVVSLWNYIF